MQFRRSGSEVRSLNPASPEPPPFTDHEDTEGDTRKETNAQRKTATIYNVNFTSAELLFIGNVPAEVYRGPSDGS